MSTNIDDTIEDLQRSLARAESVRAAYPDAMSRTLPDGRGVWTSPSVKPTNVLLVVDGCAPHVCVVAYADVTVNGPNVFLSDKHGDVVAISVRDALNGTVTTALLARFEKACRA